MRKNILNKVHIVHWKGIVPWWNIFFYFTWRDNYNYLVSWTPIEENNRLWLICNYIPTFHFGFHFKRKWHLLGFHGIVLQKTVIFYSFALSFQKYNIFTLYVLVFCPAIWVHTFEFIESVRSNSWVLVSTPSLFGFHIKRKLQLFGFLGLPLERTVGLDWGGSERLQHPASALWSLLPHPAQHLHLPEYITCPPPPYVPWLWAPEHLHLAEPVNISSYSRPTLLSTYTCLSVSPVPYLNLLL